VLVVLVLRYVKVHVLYNFCSTGIDFGDGGVVVSVPVMLLCRNCNAFIQCTKVAERSPCTCAY
jgi:hypothetical protein